MSYREFLRAVTFLTGLQLVLVHGEKVHLENLPSRVQQAIRAHVESAMIEDIDRENRNGKIIYEVGFKRNGQHVELVFSEDGEVVSNVDSLGSSSSQKEQGKTEPSDVPVPLSAARKIQLDQVPDAARRSILNHAKGAQIEDIDVGTLNGRTTFEAAFKRNGQHVELRVAEDGTVIGPALPPSGTRSAASEIGTASGKRSQNARYFEGLPGNIKSAFQKRAPGATVTDVDLERRDGRRVFEIEYVSDGRGQEIQIFEDGSIREEQPVRNAIAARTNPGTVSSHLSARYLVHLPNAVTQAYLKQNQNAEVTDVDIKKLNGRTVYEITYEIKNRENKLQIYEDGTFEGQEEQHGAQFDGAEVKAEMAQLPEAVQKTIRDQVGQAEVRDIDRTTWSGKSVFEIEFERNGKEEEILVGEDGSLLDNAGP